MQKVLGLYRSDDGNNLIAIQDQSSEDGVVFVEEDELKLLLYMNLPLFDSNGAPLMFRDGQVIGNIEDVTDMLNNSLEEDGDELEDYSEDTDDDFEVEEEYEEDEEGYEEEDYEVEEDVEEDESEEAEEEYSWDSFESEEEDFEDEEEYDEDDEYFFEEEGYEEEETAEESAITKLYSCLSDTQVETLRKYYLWLSQRIFKEANGSSNLSTSTSSISMKKKYELEQLRNSGGTWEYIGFIDFGAPVEHCTFGHRLRNMHLAWDAEAEDVQSIMYGESYDVQYSAILNSPHCIKFGIKCVSDFFEVSKESMDSLKRTQRDTIKDMALMYTYYEQGIVQQVSDSFKLLDAFVDRVASTIARNMFLSGDSEPMIYPHSIAFYRQIRNAGLIPPKSLVKEIRNTFVGWKEGKFTGGLRLTSQPNLCKNLASLYPRYKDAINVLNTWRLTREYSRQLNSVKSYLQVLFTYEICGEYKYNADTNKDEGGYSKNVKSELRNVYASAKDVVDLQSVNSDNVFSLDYVEKLLKLSQLLVKRGRDEMYGIDVPSVTSSREDWNLKVVGDYKKDYTCLCKSHGYYVELNDNEKIRFSEIASYAVDFYSVWWNYRYRPYLDRCKVIDDMLADGKSMDEIVAKFEMMDKLFDEHIEAYTKHVSEQIIARVEQENANYLKRKAEEEEQARLKQEREEERKREEERIRQEQEAERANKDESSNSSSTTTQSISVSDLIAELRKHDFGNGDGLSFHRQVFNTVTSNPNYTPSAKQLRILNEAYAKLTGNKVSQPESDKVKLSDRQDLKQAIEYVLGNKDTLKSSFDDRDFSILTSILRYGTISERQMKYAERALTAFNDSNNSQ